MRLALIGCGQIGRVHAERIAADGRGEIVVCCDPSEASARAVRDRFAPSALIETDVNRLFAHGAAGHPEGCQAVVICTPTGQHFDHVQAARSCGWPVLCEKPLADSRERIVTLIEQARTGPLLSLAYQRRYWPTFRTLRREVQSGRWGAIRSVTITSMERWQPTIAGTWRDDPAMNPGGFLGDAGSHKLDMLFFVTGLAPRTIFAQSDRRGSRVEITTTATGRLESQAPGGPEVALSMTFIGDAQHLREDYYIHCEQADLLLRDGRVWLVCHGQTEEITNLEPASDPNQALLDCLLEGAENHAPADCALPVWDLTNAILTSARTGEMLRF